MARQVGWRVVSLVGAWLVVGVRAGGAQHPQGHAQPSHGHGHLSQAAAPAAPGTHRAHGTPPGWKFTWPRGNAAKGRDVFARLECWSCHEVKGETFPAPKDAAIGPELSEMAPHHEPEFFAEALINPSAVVDDTRWAGPDGSSKMPSYNDSITVQEVIDLVAYLRSLTPPKDGVAHGKH